MPAAKKLPTPAAACAAPPSKGGIDEVGTEPVGAAPPEGAEVGAGAVVEGATDSLLVTSVVSTAEVEVDVSTGAAVVDSTTVVDSTSEDGEEPPPALTASQNFVAPERTAGIWDASQPVSGLVTHGTAAGVMALMFSQ